VNKIDVTREQLDAIEGLVVAYMVSVENEEELSKEEVKSIVLTLDNVWNEMFSVIDK